MKADTGLKVAQTETSKQDWRYDPSRVLIQAVLATAGVTGEGVKESKTFFFEKKNQKTFIPFGAYRLNRHFQRPGNNA